MRLMFSPLTPTPHLAPAVKELVSADVTARRELVSAEPRQKLRIFYQVGSESAEMINPTAFL